MVLQQDRSRKFSTFHAHHHRRLLLNHCQSFGHFVIYDPATSPLDVRPSYSAEDVWAHLTAIGKRGRHLLELSTVVDTILFAPAYWLFFDALTRSVLDARTNAALHRWRLHLLPTAVFLADQTENVLKLVLCWAFPARHDTLASVMAAATQTKLALTTVAVVVLAIGSARALLFQDAPVSAVLVYEEEGERIVSRPRSTAAATGGEGAAVGTRKRTSGSRGTAAPSYAAEPAAAAAQ